MGDDRLMENDNDWLMRDALARQSALGAVVLESSYLERLLRCIFTALVDSKYAAVVAGGKEAFWLVEHCRALAKVHRDLSEPHFAALLEVLGRIGGALKRRNRFMHDAHAVRPGPRIVTLQSVRVSHQVVVSARPVAEIQALADELGYLADDLKAGAVSALGESCLEVENELRLELGHDIDTDFG